MRRWSLTPKATLCIAALLCILMMGCTSMPAIREVPVSSAVDSTEVVFAWTAPESGSVVAYYECEWSHGQTDTTVRNKHRFTIPDSTRTRLRVRGVDADRRAGPWSIWSRYLLARYDTDIDIHEDDNGGDRPWPPLGAKSR